MYCRPYFPVYRYPSYVGGSFWNYGRSNYSFGFGFGFGFYDNCYSYGSYPFYSSCYYPLYTPTFFPAYYPTTVVVEQPTVVVVPTATVASAQYASAVTYAADGTGVPAPQVISAQPTEDASQQAGFVDDGSSPSYTDYVGPSDTGQSNASERTAVVIPPPDRTAPPAPGAMQSQNNVTPPNAPAPTGPGQPNEGQNNGTAGANSADANNPADANSPAGAGNSTDAPSLSLAELQELMTNGTRAFREGRYQQANEYFEQVVLADPYNVDAALASGVAQFASGQYDTAAESIRQGVSLYPLIVDSTFDLRERYAKPADFNEQLHKLEQFVQANPKNNNALLVLGFVQHFGSQREAAKQRFTQLKELSPDDAPFADIFLGALSPEEAKAMNTAGANQTGGANQAGGAGQAGSTSQADNVGSVVVSTQPANARVTTQPANVDQLRSGPSNPGVLSVTTRPAVMQKIELPDEPAFRGRLSLQGDLPREEAAIDGIIVRLKATDDDPPKASVDILIGDKRMKVSNFWPGAKVQVQGTSGQTYQLFLSDVDNKTETISYLIAK